jgi:hypothetical protein
LYTVPSTIEFTLMGRGDAEIEVDGEMLGVIEGDREVEGLENGDRDALGVTDGDTDSAGEALGDTETDAEGEASGDARASLTTKPNSDPVELNEVSTSLAYVQRRGRVLLFAYRLYPVPFDTMRKVSVALVATTSWPAVTRQKRLVSAPLANRRKAYLSPRATARTAKVTGRVTPWYVLKLQSKCR